MRTGYGAIGAAGRRLAGTGVGRPSRAGDDPTGELDCFLHLLDHKSGVNRLPPPCSVRGDPAGSKIKQVSVLMELSF